MIWGAFGVIFLALPEETASINYHLTLVLNFILFLLVTKGRLVEKGFLFLNYVCMYNFCGAILNCFVIGRGSILIQVIMILVIMGALQYIMYGIYFPAFTTFEACHAHFTALQREGFLIIKGTLKGILSAMERDVLTHEWGVVIDPDSEFVAIPPTIRVTPKCLKY